MKRSPPPKIIFEDKNLIVLSKPAGLLSQGAAGNDSNLVDWLRDYLGRHYVGLVHRLDRNTSGLMVVAKRTKAARRLTGALCDGRMKRVYRALVLGDLKTEKKWRHFLVKDRRQNKVRVKKAPAGTQAQEAVLSVRPVKTGQWKGRKVSLAEFELETGRSHQIRVQCAAEGYPVLGDPKYGGPPVRPGDVPAGRPMLHSYKLFFPDPISGTIKSFIAKMPADMLKIDREGSFRPAGTGRQRAGKDDFDP